MNEALLLIGHGSRDPAGVEEFLGVGRALAERRVGQPLGMAFLEFERPTISEAIDELAAGGARRIVCQPGMLFAAGHVKRDVPREVEAARQRWPGVEFQIAWELDGHAKLLELCRVRWDEAMQQHSPCPANEMALLLVGRGSSDAEANAALGRSARGLCESYGVGQAIACFSGVTAPLVSAALEWAALEGFRRIVVQPFFLFTGVLVQRIHGWTREAARRNPELEIVSTGHLGVHPLLVDVFEERARSQHGNGQSIAGGRRAG
jgi:sirohydrochlorin ferrochelatase